MSKLIPGLKIKHTTVTVLIGTLGVLVLSFYFGQKASINLFIIFVGIGAFFLFLLKPMLGVAALLIAALNLPFSIGTGTQTSINGLIILLSFLFSLWIFDQIALKHRFNLIRSRSFIPLLVLCLAAVVSLIIGQLDWFPFSPHAPFRSQIGGLALFFFSAMSFLLAAHLIETLDWLRRSVWLFLGLGAGVVIGSMVPGFGWIISLYNDGALGSLFWIWLVALSLSQALLNWQLKRGWRVVLLTMALSTTLGRFLWFRGWVSGWLPPGVAMLTILLIGFPLLGFPLSAVIGGFSLTRVQRFLAGTKTGVFTGGEEYSYLTRIEAWTILNEIFHTNPVTGFGPANYYFYTPLIPLRGYYLQFNSHNQYVDLVAQTGFIGLFFFLWFAWEIFRLGWRLKDQVQDGFSRAYAIGVLGGLMGMLASGMLGDWVIPFVYNVGFKGFQASVLGWIFLGGLVALEQITKKSRIEQIPS